MEAGTQHVQSTQHVQAAIEQVLAVRSCFQRLGHTTDDYNRPADSLAQLVQDLGTRVQLLSSSWGTVQHAQASLQASPPSHPAPTHTAERSWWQGSLQHYLQQQLQHHVQAPLPPLGQPSANQPYGAEALKGVLHRVKTHCPGILLHICNSAGAFGISTRDAAEVRLACPPVFCAGIVLAQAGTPEPLRVTLDAHNQAGRLDPWSTSPHAVFKAISSIGMCALTYFQQRASCRSLLESKPGTTPQVRAIKAGAETLEDLLLWLLSYRNLFTQPCCVDGQLLANEPTTQVPMPPLFRPYRLAKEDLLAQAVSGSTAAVHMHNASRSMLEWGED